MILWAAACREPVVADGDAPCPWGRCAAAANPADPTAAVVTVEATEAGTVWAEWSVGDDAGTSPPVTLAGITRWPVRGLPPGEGTITLTDGVQRAELPVTIPPWPAGMPVGDVDGASPDAGLWCVDADLEGAGLWACLDHDGIPRRTALAPDGRLVYVGAPLLDGGTALLEPGAIAVLDPLGAVTRTIRVGDLAPLRFAHEELDRHELVELTAGRWAGGLAFLTATGDDVGGARYVAPGIVVVDPATGAVWWDWSLHGALGDGVTIDPLVRYDRQPLNPPDPEDWFHANALVHEVRTDGEGFWLSSRSQDWLVEIDADTDGVRSILGAGGTWALSDPFYHQHAPAFLPDGRLVLLDNGNGRPDGAPPWSRVVVLALADGAATSSFTWGSADPLDPAHFWLETQGSARPTGDGAYGVVVSSEPRIDEVTTGGSVRWSMVLRGQLPVYRAEWGADAY